MPADAAATAANSGPTTIAPTTRIEESVSTAIAARITASTRKIRYDTVATAPAYACASTPSQITASSGCPGASSSSRRASRKGVPVGVSIRIAPRSSSSISSSIRSREPACSRATSHSTRSPAGLVTTPACTVTLVVQSWPTSRSPTRSVRSSGTVRRRWTSTQSG